MTAVIKRTTSSPLGELFDWLESGWPAVAELTRSAGVAPSDTEIVCAPAAEAAASMAHASAAAAILPAAPAPGRADPPVARRIASSSRAPAARQTPPVIV